MKKKSTGTKGDGSSSNIKRALALETKKQALKAGKIQEAQRLEAQRLVYWSSALSWGSAILTAVTGAAVSTSALEATVSNSTLGIIVILGAAISSVNKGAKLQEKAEDRRTTAAKYGEIRRDSDWLRFQLEHEEMETKEFMEKLEGIKQQMNELAQHQSTRTIPEEAFRYAAKKFINEHPEYRIASSITHAGGVVVRKIENTYQFLILQSTNNLHVILPKGHIEGDESQEEAARREVKEETDVDAAVLGPLDAVEFDDDNDQTITCMFFLMEESINMKTKTSGKFIGRRKPRWVSYEEAIEELSFEESKCLVLKANDLLKKSRTYSS